MNTIFWQYEEIGWSYGICVPREAVDSAKSRLEKRDSGSRLGIIGDVAITQHDCAPDTNVKMYLLEGALIIDREEGIEAFCPSFDGIERLARSLSLPLQ